MPAGDMLFESPPEIPEAQGGKAWTRLVMMLPMLAGVGAMGLFFGIGGSGGQSTLRLVASGMMGVSMVGMMVGQMGRQGNDTAQALDGDRRDYYRYLEQMRRRVRRAADQQRRSVTWRHPDPGALWSIAAGPRMWERRPDDDDFASVRVATGPQRIGIRLVPPQSKPIEDLDPLTASALRRFIRTHQHVPDLPIALALRSFDEVRLAGDPGPTRALARAMVAHLATLHSPDELRIVVLVGRAHRAEWEWIKWLPHANRRDRVDGAGPVRLVASSVEEVGELLAGDLTDDPDGPAPHVVVVVDGATPAGLRTRLPAGATWTMVGVEDPEGLQRPPGDRTALLEVTASGINRVVRSADGSPTREALGSPAQLSVVQAETLGRALAPFRPTTSGRASADGDEASEVVDDLPGLLGVADPFDLDVATAWQPGPRRDHLRVPFGIDEDGAPVWLDIKESAQGGMGPHGLAIGATGSGKSEFLRTLVLGLVMTHSPDALNLVLVDFKGGATFLGLDELEHVSAVITNLEDELHLVDRMRDALAGEMTRRQELLRRAGNYASRRDYETARENGAPLDPLPSLFIVVDEFSELLAAKPEFIDLFVMIGRLGRSLGVHLLLASQRLEEGKLRGLDTHLSYRIALRTFSASESRVVLGVPDAYELPSAPGNGYLKAGTDELVRFTAAYVSGPPKATARPPAESASRRARTEGQVREVVAFTAAPVRRRQLQPGEVEPSPAGEPSEHTRDGQLVSFQTGTLDSRTQGDRDRSALTVGDLTFRGVAPWPAARSGPQEDLSLPTDLQRLVRTIGTAFTRSGVEPPRRPWLDPLADVYDLARLPHRGRDTRLPLGVVDDPTQQRQRVATFDPDRDRGVVVLGGSGAGKTAVLRTLAASAARCATSTPVHVYGIDGTGRGLDMVLPLPCVGAVVTPDERDRLGQLVQELDRLVIDRRESALQAGAQSLAELRSHHREPLPRVLVLVDGWERLAAADQDVAAGWCAQLERVAGNGAPVGVHLAVAASQAASLPQGVDESAGLRLVLRLATRDEYAQLDLDTRLVDGDEPPGRCLATDHAGVTRATQVALLGGRVETAAQGQAVRELAQSLAGTPPAPAAPGARLGRARG